MLDVLRTFFDEKNNQLRNPRGRARAGPFYRSNINDSYRTWELVVWKLSGPPGTWREQLEERYRERPVFALVSGMAAGSWQPIHEFCEANEVPCLLPNTDVPVIGNGYYTLYFSEGLALESKVIAQHVARQPDAGPVVQVFRGGSSGELAASVMRSQLLARDIKLTDVRIDGDRPIPEARVRKQVKKSRAEALVLWLGPDDLETVASWTESGEPGAPRIYLSSTLNAGRPASIVAGLRDEAFVAHPFSLDELFENRFRRVEVWLKSRNLDVRDELIQAQTYFACVLAGEGLMHVKYDYFYRDFFLESVDHMTVLANLSASHPTLSFGPGQRFASKGCYMLPPGREVADAEWIVPGM
jgi:hypothetical protein